MACSECEWNSYQVSSTTLPTFFGCQSFEKVTLGRAESCSAERSCQLSQLQGINSTASIHYRRSDKLGHLPQA
eukprot:214808-Amphidinium_carterae.1